MQHDRFGERWGVTNPSVSADRSLPVRMARATSHQSGLNLINEWR